MNESRSAATVTLEGFEVTSPESEQDELREQLNEAAYEISSSVGAALASCGTSAVHGNVTVTINGVTGTAGDDA